MFMALSSILNARIVGRLGTRRVSHSALLGYIVLAITHSLVALAGVDGLWTFAVLQSCMMFCFGLMAPNFGAMAMERSEEHTSELQSLMRISYAVFCLKKK